MKRRTILAVFAGIFAVHPFEGLAEIIGVAVAEGFGDALEGTGFVLKQDKGLIHALLFNILVNRDSMSTPTIKVLSVTCAIFWF